LGQPVAKLYRVIAVTGLSVSLLFVQLERSEKKAQNPADSQSVPVYQ
jgi:hypothetical protein